MSTAAPQINHDGDGATVLPFSPASRQSFQKVLEQLVALEPQIVSDLENESEAELLKLWAGFKKLGRHEWYGKCAIAAATWHQTSAAKRGRGNRDIAAKGILAAVSKRSKKMGLTPTTVYRMSQIFRLVQDFNSQENLILEHNILDLLDEQGYWDQALNAADPIKAILTFADKKTTLPRFRVTDAERLVLSPELSRKAAALKAVEQGRENTGQLSAREALISHIRSAQDVVRNLIIPGCPDPEFRDRVWDELLVELEEEYQELFDEDACNCLREAWEKGNRREDNLAAATKFPMADVSRLMAALSNMGEFIRVQVRDVSKRTPFQLWHKVGEPFDNAKLMPMAKRG